MISIYCRYDSSTSLYYISLSLGFGNMMIDINIQISISETSSGWATNYVVVGNSEYNIKHRDCPPQDNIYMVDTWWAILSTLGIRIAQRAMLTSNHRKS